MNKIVEKKHFSEKVVQLVVEAPLIARSRRAGHFVIVRADEHGERIPLTIADSDTTAGTITLVVQAVGKSTKKICDKAVGDSLHDVVGPLGQATKIEKVGTVVCCGGGVGVAPLLPIIRAMKQAARSYYGLYVPRMMWRELDNFSTNSVALILASTPYDASDYIEDFNLYKTTLANGK